MLYWKKTWLPILALLVSLFAAQTALANQNFDNGTQIDVSNPYTADQTIGDIFDDGGIYGKLEGATPIDIYKFTPSRAGKQTITLLTRQTVVSNGTDATSDPTIIFVDPTDSTQGESLNLPLPDDTYHAIRMATPSSVTDYYEPALLQRWNVTKQQTLDLQKGKTYYLVVLDPFHVTSRYVLKMGDGKIWSGSDFFKHFNLWFRIQTDNYAGSSPFIFTPYYLGLILFLLGLTVLLGVVIIQEAYSMMANRFKTAGYLLIKMQPFTRVLIWISVWFTAIGGYIYFDHFGWPGIPYVLMLLFIVIVLNMGFVTFWLAPRVMQLEVSKKEATIAFSLRKRWFFSTLVSVFSFGAFLTFLSIYLAR